MKTERTRWRLALLAAALAAGCTASPAADPPPAETSDDTPWDGFDRASSTSEARPTGELSGPFDVTGLLAQETYVRMNETNQEAGAPRLHGEVLSGGVPWGGLFELRITRQLDAGDATEGAPLRVLFSDLTGGFQAWPEPGVHRVEVLLDDGRTSAPLTVSFVDGADTELDVTVP